MNLFKNLRIAWHAFWWGLRQGDETILKQTSGTDSPGEEDVVTKGGGLMDELLQKQETQRVAEFRDEQYRITRETSKYKIDTKSLEYTEDGEVKPESVKIIEKDSSKDNGMLGIMVNEGETVIVEQLNENIMNASYETTPDNYDDSGTRTIKIERNFVPKFKIESYAKKIVVKHAPELNESEYYLDIYCSVYHKELYVKGIGTKAVIDKSDVFFIKEAEQLVAEKITKSDIIDFNSIEFITHKAYGAPDLNMYKYAYPNFISCTKFDGNFVFTFKALAIVNGYDLTEKYRLESVDKKYNTGEQKTDTFQMNELTTNMVYGGEE